MRYRNGKPAIESLAMQSKIFNFHSYRLKGLKANLANLRATIIDYEIPLDSEQTIKIKSMRDTFSHILAGVEQIELDLAIIRDAKIAYLKQVRKENTTK